MKGEIMNKMMNGWRNYMYGTSIKKSYRPMATNYLTKEKEMATVNVVRRKVVVKHLPKALKALDEAKVQSEKIELMEVLGRLQKRLGAIEGYRNGIKNLKASITELEKESGLKLTKEQKNQLTNTFRLIPDMNLDKVFPSLFE